MKKNSFYGLMALFSMFFLSTASAMENPDLEGWIVKIDTTKSTLRVLSANGAGQDLPHDKVVMVKPGLINDYKLNDYVQVKFGDDMRYALMIEKSAPRSGRQDQAPKA